MTTKEKVESRDRPLFGNEFWGLVWLKNGDLHAGAVELKDPEGWVKIRIPDGVGADDLMTEVLIPRDEVRMIGVTTFADVIERHNVEA